MKLLDTNVLIYHVKGLLATPLTGPDYLVSIITEIEVLSHPASNPQVEADLRALLQTVQVLQIDDPIKEEAIRLRRSTKLRLPDAVIVATAVITGSELLTHDADLLKMPGITVSAPPLK